MARCSRSTFAITIPGYFDQILDKSGLSLGSIMLLVFPVFVEAFKRVNRERFWWRAVLNALYRWKIAH